MYFVCIVPFKHDTCFLKGNARLAIIFGAYKYGRHRIYFHRHYVNINDKGMVLWGTFGYCLATIKGKPDA